MTFLVQPAETEREDDGHGIQNTAHPSSSSRIQVYITARTTPQIEAKSSIKDLELHNQHQEIRGNHV